jgi:hypothetical protein
VPSAYIPPQPQISRVIDRQFQEDVDRLLLAIKNLIERSSPAHVDRIPGYQPFLLVVAHAAKTTYEAMKFLIADDRGDSRRKLEFGLAISPLIRFLIELLFLVIVIRQKPRKNVMWYHRSGWRELKEALDRLKAEPGSARRFRTQIAKQEAALEYLRQTYKITKRLAANPQGIPYWPHPGQILKLPKLRSRHFLKYLYTWFYSELSQEAHVSGAGLVRMYSKLLIESTDADRDRVLKVIKSNNYMLALILVLATVTELNDIGSFDRTTKLSYLWTVVVKEWTDAKRLYTRRYKRILKSRQ